MSGSPQGDLRKIYEQAAAEISGRPELICELSGRCCRFREAGHELYLTALEFEEMVAHGGFPAGQEDRCPWYQGGLCANREGRALACRSYFCSDETSSAAVTERWHKAIRELHEEWDLPYVYQSLGIHWNQREESASKEVET